MQKIHSLRRQGLLLMALGLGIVIGRTGINESLVVLIVLMIVWLFSYDFAVENQFGRRKRNERKANESAVNSIGQNGRHDSYK
ncbi:hypothetical protein [Candidatus Enterococcus clewellii]|uniref:hypothetical protein n=1 Tax=Candidatus Enterococcus clewellii TaxID=1834193 RepID=UPI000A34E0A4|nr:hypothetical protein [Enterococcus sp. 9E7_DIV0242]